MPSINLSGTVALLSPRKGAYHYLRVDKDVLALWPKKNKTRLLCTINDFTFPCGLNPLGDGHYFIILGKEKREQSNIKLGDNVAFTLSEHPSPLGVEVPEVLNVMLDQDPQAKHRYQQLTDGKKRALIFMLQKTKNIDLQVKKILTFLQQQ